MPYNANPNDIAKLMQNLNATAHASNLGNTTKRKESTGYRYGREYDNEDDSEDDSDEDDDEDEDDEDFDEDESETDANTHDKEMPKIVIGRSNPRELSNDIEQFRNQISASSSMCESGTNIQENRIGEPDLSIGPDSSNNVDGLYQGYQNFELDEEVDSENLISDEEDDNESGFLSQI